MRLRLAIGFAFLGSGALGADPPPQSPYDVTSYSVVVSEPGMRDVTVTKGTWGDGLAFEITRPVAARAPGAKSPAVVFVNGVGGKLNEWEIYRSWARLLAVRGLAGVTFESRAAGSAAGVKAFFEHLAKNAGSLGLEASRLAAWSCSANVYAALPALMAEGPIAFRAAVFYYGTGSAPALRKDLPVFWVLAGRDDETLVAGQKALFARAVEEKLPWTMVSAPDLPHAFDAVEDTPRSRHVVEETLAFLEAFLAPAAPPADVPLPRKATAYLYANEPGKTAAVCREILAKNPGDREARRLLGLSLLRAGKPAEAVDELTKAVALGEDGAVVHQSLGEALLRMRRPAEAVDHYRKAVERGSKYPPVLFGLARAAALSGRADEAFFTLNILAETGWPGRAQVESEPDLSPLRSDPRWATTLAKIPQAPAGR